MLNKSMIEKMKNSLNSGVMVQVAPQLFPTSAEIGSRMSKILNIKPTDEILEPQAGTGALINVCGNIWHQKGRLVAVEINHRLCEALKRNYHQAEIHCGNFLDLTPKKLGKFDKIIMNPPFEKHQDVEHIQHAFKFLKEDGELVAIACEGPFFRQCKKSREFREFLKYREAENFRLEAGAFKQSGTMVNSRLIHIRRSIK